jgi:predicted lipid carrier protein YhbT
MLPRMIQRDALTVPLSSLHVHCTDVAGEWMVTARGAGVHVERVHAKGDAALRGPAEALLLRLWGRTPSSTIEVIGDQAGADAWLALGGA